jgi:hypothetical protein
MKSPVGAAIAAALAASWRRLLKRVRPYDFQFLSPEATATGQFAVDPTNDQVTSISGSVSVNGQPADTITTILADPSFPSPYNHGPFIYDNTYYAGNPVFDVDGVLCNRRKSWRLVESLGQRRRQLLAL